MKITLMPNTAHTICLAEKEKKKPSHNIFLVIINSIGTM